MEVRLLSLPCKCKQKPSPTCRGAGSLVLLAEEAQRTCHTELTPISTCTLLIPVPVFQVATLGYFQVIKGLLLSEPGAPYVETAFTAKR